MGVILIILIIILLFGAKKMPEIGQNIGRGIAEFKKAISDKTDDSGGHGK